MSMGDPCRSETVDCQKSKAGAKLNINIVDGCVVFEGATTE